MGYVLLPFYAGFYYALLSVSIITFGEMLSTPFAYDYVTRTAHVSERGKYLGLYSFAMVSLPLFLAPIIMPTIYTILGANTLWYSVGVISVITFAGLWWL